MEWGRTDLAVEINENIDRKDSAVKGIIVERQAGEKIDVISLEILNEHGSQIMNRPVGRYITIEAPDIVDFDESDTQRLVRKIVDILLELIEPRFKKILITGLGNRQLTADCLGPAVVDKICITNENRNIDVRSIAPGVLAQTGMETADIIKGIVDKTSPQLLIAIDALAARNIERLNSTIQISNKGINPGSGVGNHRIAIDENTMGIPVIAIGVPTVIDAKTIVADTLKEAYDRDNVDETVNEEYMENIARMYVTLKDVDYRMEVISDILAKALNCLAEQM